MENIKIVVKPQGAMQEVKEIANTLEELQKTVGGYITKVSHPELENICIICDEDGLSKGKEQNIWMENIGFGGEWLVGTVVFAGIDNGECVSLTDEQIKKIDKFIWG